ncbi:hypothetical protein OJ253_2996 [Cryptosporidium canis]|uniref:Uncharacterized protein n=1 Tax=Cryptosporidium canis TaxID=195482 RepID=A0A9D5DEJ3_9CRYT|nr:hypothetical protein OJ253_2996 [Cryptosporidium canis]
MTSSTKTQDSFESCNSAIFDNSQDSFVDTIHETLNNKVFLLPSSYNDIWLVNQLDQLKLISQNGTGKYTDDQNSGGCNSMIQDEISSVCPNDNPEILENEFSSSTKLSDVINKLLSSKNSVNTTFKKTDPDEFSVFDNDLLSEEDTIIIDELIKDHYFNPLNLELSENNQSSIYTDNNGTSICDNIIGCERGNIGTRNTTNYISDNAYSLTPDEIDGIKEILSQEN